MKSVSARKAFRWMLAGWMLLATSITSSTYVHGHSGGDVSHHHDGVDCSQPSPRLPEVFHNDHDGNVWLSATDVHQHGYLTLLGITTYLPMSGGPTNSDEKSTFGGDATMAVVAVSAAQGVRALSKSLSADQFGLVSLARASIGSICESKRSVSSGAGAAPAAPLCDRARHERSGVQLS